MNLEYYCPDHPSANEDGHYTFKNTAELTAYVKTLPRCGGCIDRHGEGIGATHSYGNRDHGLQPVSHIKKRERKSLRERFEKFKERVKKSRNIFDWMEEIP